MRIGEDTTLREMMEAFCETFGDFHSSMYGLVLKQGREYTPAPLPDEIRRGTPKWCFSNSVELAKSHGYAYVEGFAISSVIQGMPIHHAWNVTEDGTVIDRTWVPEGVEYYGVVCELDEYDPDSWLTPLGIMTD